MSKGLTLLLCAAALICRTQARAESHLVRIDDCSDASQWSVNLGWEFPGAQGRVGGAKDSGGRCAVLRYDFTGGGNYVAAMRPLGVARATAVSFTVRQEGANYGFARVRDASGQEHAGSFRIEGAGRQRVTLPLNSETFGGHWGGKNDGVFHFPLDTILVGVSKGTTPAGSLYIGDLSIVTDDPSVFFGVKVRADGPSNVVFASGKPLTAACIVTNRVGEPAVVGFSVKVTDWHGRGFPVPARRLSLAPYASATIAIKLPGDRPQYYRVEAVVWARDGFRTRDVDGVVVVRRPRNFGVDDPRSFFGIQQSTDGARTERLGVKWVRAGMDWQWGEMTRGQYAPASVQGVRRNHQLVMYTMSAYPPEWALKEAGKEDFWVGKGADERVGWWQSYVERRARELAADVDTFEIQNEPDLTCMWQAGIPFAAGVERYERILRAGTDAVRRGAPNARVAGIDVSGGDYDQNLPFSRAMFARAGNAIDVYTGHPYAGVRYFGKGQEPMWPGRNEERRKCADTLAMIRSAHGRQRFWVGEKGWGLNVKADPLSVYSRDFARCLVQSMVTAHSAPGVERYFWFMEEGCNEGGYEYGLFRGGKPLPAALAYSVLANALYHAAPSRSATLGGILAAHSFRSVDSRLGTTVIWSEKGEAMLSLKGMPGGTRLIDIAGAEKGSPAAGGEWRIRVDRSPVYLQYPLANAARAESSVASARVEVARPLAIEAAYVVDSSTFAVRVRNLTDRPIRCTASTAGTAASAVARPLASTVVAVHLRRPIANAPNGVRVVVTGPGAREEAVARTDFTPCPKVAPPAGGATGGWLQTGVPVVLNRREQILPSDPGIGWDGPEDLSARMWVTWDASALRLYAAVRDDVHVVVSEQPESFWNGDSLQIGIDPRNDAGPAPGYDRDDLELGMTIGAHGPWVFQTWPAARRLDLKADGKREGHNTTYRVDIPWTLLGVTPRAGLVLGFNVIVNDNDGNGRAYWMGMTPGIGEGKHPSVFRKLLLVE